MRHVLWTLCLAAGCDDSFTPAPQSPSDDPMDAVCPDGLAPASDAGVAFSSFLVDGLAVATSFVADTNVDGVPASCVAGDGLSGQLQLLSAGEAYGALIFAVPGDGNHALSDAGVTVAFDLHGADFPVTFGAADWQTGTVVVAVEGDAVILEIQGSAVTGGRTLSVQGTVEVVP